MVKCKLLVPVTLYDGTNQDDIRFVDFKFLTKDLEFESNKDVPDIKSIFKTLLCVLKISDTRTFDYNFDLTIADVTYIGDMCLLYAEVKQLHVNYNRIGNDSMREQGWRWMDIPFDNTYENGNKRRKAGRKKTNNNQGR